MTGLAIELPARRTDLIIRPIGNSGRYVVKNPSRRDYFQLGEEERLLLLQLNGNKTAADVCDAFEHRFGERLTTDDLCGFIEMARGQGLLQSVERRRFKKDVSANATLGRSGASAAAGRRASKQSILFWRKCVFNPDQLFNWIEPKVRFFWTRAFFLTSSACIVQATFVLWTHRQDVVSSFAHAVGWETVLIAWLTILVVGTLHEFAHGLTCKHHGGEVREIGILLLYFMPGLFCNVSDAWLFREKSKRLWVTLAGGYFELFLWALAVFAWRLTIPNSLANYLAFVVLSVSGMKSFFNFNPLIKLDGYYLLSDWAEIPNLRQQSLDHLMRHLRWLLWGGPRPQAELRGRFLLVYGLACWVFSLFFVTLMLAGIFGWLWRYLGILSVVVICLLACVTARGLLGGLFREEFSTMVYNRHKRKMVWLTVLAGLVAAGVFVPWNDRASGRFEIRAITHVELRAPVAGFLQEVYHDEGQTVSPECVVARLAVPDLVSRIAQKRAETHESEAKLKLLLAGPRAEEITQQRRRVEAARAWRDVAARDLARQEQSLTQDLIRFDKVIEQCQAECDYAKHSLARIQKLRRKDTVTEDEYLAALKAYLVARAECDKTKAERASRAALGTFTAQSNLAHRAKELADTEATLELLEAGSRSEEIEAAQATVSRLREERDYLVGVQSRLTIHSPVDGMITTRRLKEKVGDYFREGDLLCEVEDAETLEIVIALDEDRAARVRPGQTVRLKARSLPFEVFEVEVERISPRAESGDVQSQVMVYCRLDDPTKKLRSRMTGHARIQCGRATLAYVLANNCLRFIRTEFWW